MQTFQQLYLQNPLWVWLAAGAAFLAIDMAMGLGFLVWPGLAAAVVGLLNLGGVHLGLGLELVLFAALSGCGVQAAQTAGLRGGARMSPQTLSKPPSQRLASETQSRLILDSAGVEAPSSQSPESPLQAAAQADEADGRSQPNLAPIPLPVRPAYRTGAAMSAQAAFATRSGPATRPALDGRKPLTFRPPDPSAAPRRAPPVHVETRAPAMAMQLAGQSGPEGSGGPRRVVVASSSAARLIGRIGRTTAAFVNGSGVIWIDGGEWRADVDEGINVLAKDAPVRVLGIGAEGRLQVRGLAV